MISTTEKGLTFFNPESQEIVAIAHDHPRYDAILAAVLLHNYAEATKLANISQAIEDFAYGVLEAKNGVVYHEGEAESPAVSRKIVEMLNAGSDSMPIINFIRKRKENPSRAAQEELLLFWAANDLLLHEDGDMIAYKFVDENYMSCHADEHGNKVDNHVGCKPSMPRNKVDDNRNNTCSYGYHFCALEYCLTQMDSQGGSHIMLVKVNPRDVVSIPVDYNNQKARCCAYEVISEVRRTHVREDLPAMPVYTNNDLRKQYWTIRYNNPMRRESYLEDIDTTVFPDLPVGPWTSEEQANDAFDGMLADWSRLHMNLWAYGPYIAGPFNSQAEALRN